MPKVVDHESRRREIAAAVWRAVGRVGLDAVTVRDIAEEAGYSTGVLAHYFADKDEMILHALRVWIEEAVGRMERRSGKETGLSALRKGLQECLPLDDRRRGEWQVWLSFWGRAAGDQRLSDEQRQWYVLWRGIIRNLILSCQREGLVPAGLDAEREADALAAFVDGLGLQATIEPERLSTEVQTSLLEHYLNRLREVPIGNPAD